MDQPEIKIESRFETIFNHVNEGILIANGRGEIILVNPRCNQMFGYEEDELKGLKVETLVPSELHDRHIEHRESYMRHPIKRPMGKNLILHGQRKDQTRFPLEISLSYYDTNEGMYAIGFVIDITERYLQQEKIQLINNELRILNETLEKKVNERTLVLKEALNELERSRDELTFALEKEKELNEMKTRFISMASHEFRTPLSTVLSSATLISKYATEEDHEKREKHITRIKNSVTSLTEILNDFLSIGKLDEGKMSARIVETDLCKLIEDVIAEMQAISRPGQRISFGHSGDPLVNVDKLILRNVLINLLSNAIKFSPENSVIEVNSERKSDKLVLTVRDHGMGIPEDDQKYLFGRFFRGKNAQNIQGTGLGLNIVQRYLELMNGSIDCESELEKGTSFIICLPA